MSAQAADDKAVALTGQLLEMGGTAHIFESPRVQAALADPQAFQQSFGRGFDTRRLERLLGDAGFKLWQERPRVLALQAQGEAWQSLAENELFMREARYRGLPVAARAVPDALASVIQAVQTGDETALPGLLKASQADALLLLWPAGAGGQWQFLQPGRRLVGELRTPEAAGLLAHVLSERLAAAVQWPEADGRSVLRLGDIGNLQEFMAAQAALAQLPGVKGLSLVRLDGRQAFFALDVLPLAGLAAESRLQPPASSLPVLPPRVLQGLQQGSLLLSRTWKPAPAQTPIAP